MSILFNHSLVKFPRPQVVLSASLTVPNATASLPLSFSRAPQLGELIILFVGTNNSIGTVSLPAGFAFRQISQAGTSSNYCYTKSATASETNSYTVTFTNASDTRTVTGIVVSSFAPAGAFDTFREKEQTTAVLPPATLIATPFTVQQNALALVHVKVTGNFRASSTLTNGFTIIEQQTNAASMQTLVGYKTVSVAADIANVTTTWSWSGGTVGFTANWCIVNAKTT